MATKLDHDLAAAIVQFGDIADLLKDSTDRDNQGRNAYCLTDQPVVEALENVDFDGLVKLLRDAEQRIASLRGLLGDVLHGKV